MNKSQLIDASFWAVPVAAGGIAWALGWPKVGLAIALGPVALIAVGAGIYVAGVAITGKT